MDQPATIVQDAPVPAAPAKNDGEHVKPVHCGTHTRGLLLVGVFKLCKASIAVLSGVAAYHLTHVDPGELALRLVSLLRIDPMGRLAMAILDEADTISTRGLRHLGELSFVLAVLYLVEGGGLMLEKVWAEYFTVVMTAGALPFEIHELIKRYTDVRVGVLVANVAVVVYLIVLLREKRRKAGECA